MALNYAFQQEGLQQTLGLEQAHFPENSDYLQSQLITYIGNKRALLPLIAKGFEHAIKELGKDQVSILDLFSGSGVVSRLAKQYAHTVIANDLETYSSIINQCYLSNYSEINQPKLNENIKFLDHYIQKHWEPSFITELYAPSHHNKIKPEDRVFYTRHNAIFLDTACQGLKQIPLSERIYLLGPLLSQASMHVNTSGVFKGFYKNKEGIGQFGGQGQNALTRILKNIELRLPVLSRFNCDYTVHQSDANELVKNIKPVDVAYLDPPYNQHPYGSNYFMLNLLCHYKKPNDLSKVSGIPKNWNRSAYNKRAEAQNALMDVVKNCPASFILISYNSEGFISFESFISELEKYGKVSVLDTSYNTFRGCRNLRDRNTHVTEYLYMVDKR